MADSLPPSRLYTFVDASREFALYFLEGQRLIRDLALLHGSSGEGLSFFRDVVLSFQPLIALLKGGEQIGVYIDSREPFFRFKMETNHSGATRSVLAPDDLREFPGAIHGKVRLLKIFPERRAPYESVLDVDGVGLGGIVNKVLAESYQVLSAVVVSRESDQSLMLHQLPPLPRSPEYDYSPEALDARRAGIHEQAKRIFGRALHDAAAIESVFRGLGFRMLADREVRLECSCSKSRMTRNVRGIRGISMDELFDPGQEFLEIVCEYCKSRYLVSREDLDDEPDSIH